MPALRSAAPLLLAAVAALLAACGDPPADRGEASSPAELDSAALAAQQARADSIAEREARFGGRVPRPDSVRALYVNGWAAGSRSRMRDLIAIADSTEVNAFVVDIKESDTYLTYDSTGIELAREIGADQRPASKWLPALVDTLRAHGIYPIARIVVFKDRMLAEKKPELAIRDPEGDVWLDPDGKPWVNPYDRRVWEYNLAIAREALEMGFQEIQWDYVRFPDVTEARRRTMRFPGSDDVSREDNIAAFLRWSRDELAEWEVPVTADVFGLSTHLEGDVGIGQQWEKVVSSTDYVLPMVYPSHYYRGLYRFDHPVAHPYEVVRLALEDARERTEHLRERGEEVAEVMPWLEAQTATWVKPTVPYGPAELRAQIEATYDAGMKHWVLWNPGSRYGDYLDAFRPESGGPSAVERRGWRPPEYEVPRNRLSMVVRRRDAAADSARRAAAARSEASAAPASAPPASRR